MNKLVLRFYDYFSKHRRLMVLLLLATVALFAALIFRIHFKEDITDFLPLDQADRQAMKVYQNLSGADKIVVLISRSDGKSAPDELVEAADDLTAQLQHAGIQPRYIQSQIDYDAADQMASFVYDNIPYFLTDADYQRMEHLLKDPSYPGEQLERDKQMLFLPGSGLLSAHIGQDPFNLFTPVVQQLADRQGANYELYDGYLFTPRLTHAMVIVNSPYGSSETAHNSQLVRQVEQARGEVLRTHPSLKVQLTGGPVIAYGNAHQIKIDSLISVILAVVLITLLLVAAFRSLRNILLIVVSIAWGWLFALGMLSLVDRHLSIIVIGISSVIIGIAINYPLHLISHLSHTPDRRHAMGEILMPLLIGNITTIGAFLTLVPLESVALRDLGLFAAFLLLGTILFVVLFLPHLVKPVVSTRPHTVFLGKISNLRLDRVGWLIAVVALLTLPLARLSTQCHFDTDLTHINYMSDEQRDAMKVLSQMRSEDDSHKTVFFLSTGKSLDAALAADESVHPKLHHDSLSAGAASISGCAPFFCSKGEQQRRLQRWQAFVQRYGAQLKTVLSQNIAASGFAPDAFAAFIQILDRSYRPQPQRYFSPLQPALGQYLYNDPTDKTWSVVTQLRVPANRLDATLNRLQHIGDSRHHAFEIGQLNSVMANNINNEFNYIGWACGFIVFFFLWFAMGNFELAALSFLPMAVSWVWILGIMALLHIDFNIVNIILATFIFGQGDDYTIFMTEGSQYEYAYGRRLLGSYRNSILISALIMFIGIGTLIIARHPALHGLAEVTIVGMFSVVLMAWLLPPFLFRWLVSRHGELRHRPLTLRSLLMPHRYPQQCATGQPREAYVAYVRDVYYYCGTDIVKTVRKATAAPTDATEHDGQLIVPGGSYGAVALMEALAHPDLTVIAQTIDDADRAVTERMACRIAPNIKTTPQDTSL